MHHSDVTTQQQLKQDPALDLALSYAAHGWPVFPCRPADDYDPETGEVLPEKAPLISNGFRGATLNERVIKELWKRNPGALIGVPTGERINAWVLDLDVKPNANGHEWLAAMEDVHGELPFSARVQTANGGTHIFFRYVEGVRNRGKMGAGVDVRGEGGFVVGAGSVMADGREYHWLDDSGPETIVDAPQWLLDLVTPPANTYQPGEYTYTAGTNDAYVNRAVQAEVDELASTPPGNRGYQLNASAFALGQFVGAGAYSRDEAEHALYSAAVACGVAQKDGERETRAKIRRGLDAGQKQPRQIPQPASNDNTRLVDIKRMLERAREKAAKEEDGEPKPEPDPQQLQPTAQQAGKQKRNEDGEPAIDDPVRGEKASNGPDTTRNAPERDVDQPPIRATPFNWKDPKTLSRREFAFGTHYIRKYVSVTVAPGGLGKTSNSIVEALAMASGKPLNGTKPSQRLKVWLFNVEDPRDELERRIMAACIHFGLTPDDINGHLFLDTGREQELVVAIDDKKGVRIQEPIVEAVAGQIRRNGIDVMIVDPFVSTHRVNENDNGAIDAVAKLWAQVADDTNSAIDIVHHLRKVADREATVEDARGAVALIGAARSVRVLNRMSEAQAQEAALTAADRFGYFSITYGKSNLTPLSSRLDWRHLVSVPLGNGRGIQKPQDFAPVVAEWTWPSAESVVDGITDEQRDHIKTLLDNGSYKAATQAKPWAGEAVAYALGLDMEDAMQKKRAASILKAMLKEGILTTVNERDPISRQSANFVRSAA